MTSIFESLTTYMIVGIIVVIGISQLNRIAGAVMSVIFWGAVAYVGHGGYAEGHAVGLPGTPFSEPVFLGVCAFFMLLHVGAAFTYVNNKRRAEARKQMLYGDDDD